MFLLKWKKLITNFKEWRTKKKNIEKQTKIYASKIHKKLQEFLNTPWTPFYAHLYVISTHLQLRCRSLRRRSSSYPRKSWSFQLSCRPFFETNSPTIRSILTGSRSWKKVGQRQGSGRFSMNFLRNFIDIKIEHGKRTREDCGGKSEYYGARQ